MTEEAPESGNNMMSYVLGGVLVVAVVAGGYFLRPKTSPTTPEVATAPVVTPTPGAINGLGCDYQYYNPVIGFEKYYLTVEGGDVSDAKEVDCTFKVTQENKVVTTENVTSGLTAKPEREGSVFKCTTDALELKSTVPTKVDISLTDDTGAKATCSALFALPKP